MQGLWIWLLLKLWFGSPRSISVRRYSRKPARRIEGDLVWWIWHDDLRWSFRCDVLLERGEQEWRGMPKRARTPAEPAIHDCSTNVKHTPRRNEVRAWLDGRELRITRQRARGYVYANSYSRLVFWLLFLSHDHGLGGINRLDWTEHEQHRGIIRRVFEFWNFPRPAHPENISGRRCSLFNGKILLWLTPHDLSCDMNRWSPTFEILISSDVNYQDEKIISVLF